jgi:hypothetical protein
MKSIEKDSTCINGEIISSLLLLLDVAGSCA